MQWQRIWYVAHPGRLRCGWRVLAFLALALPLSIVLTILLALPVSPTLQDPSKFPPYLLMFLVTLAVTVVFIVVGIWALRVLEHLPAHTLGLTMDRAGWRRLFLGVVAGMALIALTVTVLRFAGWAHLAWQPPTLQQALVLAAMAIGALLLALNEEVVFHGYVFQTLLRGIGPLGTLLLTATAFAGIHLQNDHVGPLALVNILVTSLLFGMVYLRRGSLWPAIGMHAGWYFGQLCCHLPVSGNAVNFPTPLVVTLTGPAWLTGGAFGLEGSSIASLVLLAALALVAYARQGLALASAWWEWRTLEADTACLLSWDFAIDDRYYQWKLLADDPAE